MVAAIVAAAAVLAGAVAITFWPVTVGLAAIVVLVISLARGAPVWALAVALLMAGFEGSVKILLGLEPTPLPFSAREVDAAAIDLALLAAVAGVVAADRFRTPLRLWARTGRAERAAMAAFGGWVVLSIVQIAAHGDVVRGL
ncbi:MAG: hypothetical protein QOG41_1700, partial [Thermoleophilaceae bacterium]|nr:hypothetical protein [Thermoleophilaceae bacterium]